MKTSLTIAGFDPSGWAGASADLLTFERLGVRGLSAITALTAQNTRAVKGVFPIKPSFLTLQVEALLEEFRVDSVKVGMLGTHGNAAALLRLAKAGRLNKLVLDPVFLSTSGFPLLDKFGIRLISEILPFVTLVTPNMDEASRLTGLNIKGVSGMEEAAKRLNDLGAPNVLVKGGHLKGEPVDVFYDGRSLELFKGRRVAGNKSIFHGTGCVLSSAIAAYLARGAGIKRAVREAKRYLEKTLKERGAFLKAAPKN